MMEAVPLTELFSDGEDTSSFVSSGRSGESIGSASSGRSCESIAGSQSLTFGFDEKTRKTDLSLIFSNECVYVSRAVLELMSPVFQKLLDANEDKEQIELGDASHSEFVEFLACFYPGKSHKVTTGNVFKMLPLADEYGIDHVKNQCETVLQTMLGSIDTTTDLFYRCIELVYKHKLDSLKGKCLNALVKRPLGDLQRACCSDNLPADAKVDLYESFVPSLLHEVCKYRYLLAGMHTKRSEKFKGWQDVTYFTIEMCMKADVEGIQKSSMLEVCGLRWFIHISRHLSGGVLRTFTVSLRCCPNQNVCQSFDSCEGTVTFVVKNNIPWNDNVTKETQFSLTPSEMNAPDVRVQESVVFDRDAGFLMDKKYGITAHILLQNPVFKTKGQPSDIESAGDSRTKALETTGQNPFDV